MKQSYFSINYYIFSVIFPIIAILVVFGYSAKYLQDEKSLINHEILGLKRINDIQSVITPLQKLRELSILPIISKEQRIQKTQYIKTINYQIAILNSTLQFHQKKFKTQVEINSFIFEIEKLLKEKSKLTKNELFKRYSNIVRESLLLYKDISSNSNLIFDPYLDTYLLAETITFQIPELIESVEQLKKIAISIKTDKPSINDITALSNQTAEVNSKVTLLSYNIEKLYISGLLKTNLLKNSYEIAIKSQKALIKFIEQEIVQNKKAIHSFDKFLNLSTTQYKAIIDLYNQNLKLLHNQLLQRVSNKETIQRIIIIIGVLSIIFIIYSHINYYRKSIQLIKTVKVFQKKSITDDLTGLYNRRHFDTVISRQLKKIKRDEQPSVFIMCEIDSFKEYIDAYDHKKGDEIIQVIAKSLKISLHRPGDFIFRLGNEEFGLLLKDNMELEKTTAFTKILKNNIENLKLEHPKNPAGKFVTVSMGIVLISDAIEHEEESVYQGAYKALNYAKKHGGNQVVIYDIDKCEVVNI